MDIAQTIKLFGIGLGLTDPEHKLIDAVRLRSPHPTRANTYNFFYPAIPTLFQVTNLGNSCILLSL